MKASSPSNSTLNQIGRVLRSSKDVEPYVLKVAQWADENKQSFGFLPSGSYAEAAARGRLWIATDDAGELLGYLFFGGRFPNISITQLFVTPSARSKKIGCRLVDELKKYAEQTGVQTISARVAADLEANVFWEKSNFLLLRQVQGGQTTNRTINVRFFEVPQSSLWQSNPDRANLNNAFLDARPPSIVPNYALDLNVFFDVVKGRVEAESGARLIGAAMANRLRVCVTSEFVEELMRHTRDVSEDPVLSFAKNLPTLPHVPSDLLNPKIADLRSIIFPDAGRSVSRKANDDSDLIHLAICIHHKTSAFVTREKAILRSAEELERRFQLEVVSPADILQAEYEGSTNRDSINAHVDGGSFRLEMMSEAHRSSVEIFLKSRVGLNDQDTQRVLDPGTDHSSRSRLIAFADEELVGFCSYSRSTLTKCEVSAFIAVDECRNAAQQFVDHVLQRISHEAPSNLPALILLKTHDAQQLVISTALDRLFVPQERKSSDCFVSLRRVAFRGVLTPGSWEGFRRKLDREFHTSLPEKCPTFLEAKNTGIPIFYAGASEAKPRRLSNFETFYAPLLMALPGRAGALVPIREAYAHELLQLPITQMSLLPSKEAQLRIERAYFGKPGFEKAFARDGLVVFYVSGQGQRGKEAVGVARVTYAGKVPVIKAKQEFFRYGVLEQQTLEEIVNKDGLVGMFTFDSFTPFSSRVSYDDLLRMDCIGGANLITAQKLSDSQLLKVIQAGFKEID